jgi:hypothetical protein
MSSTTTRVDNCQKICDNNKNCAGIVYRPVVGMFQDLIIKFKMLIIKANQSIEKIILVSFKELKYFYKINVKTNLRKLKHNLIKLKSYNLGGDQYYFEVVLNQVKEVN